MDDKRPLEKNLESVMISQAEIARRVAELGDEISRDYEGKDFLLVAILKGGAIFLADLSRAIGAPHAIEFLGASSYGESTVSSGRVRITKDLDIDIGGRHLILCEDIFDTGRTLKHICDLLELKKPASLKICALLVKDRVHEQPMKIDYVGFTIPDKFVVGYGLDYKEHYRNLPMVGVLKREVYAGQPASNSDV